MDALEQALLVVCVLGFGVGVAVTLFALHLLSHAVPSAVDRLIDRQDDPNSRIDAANIDTQPL
jgi:hypothetical protein